MGPVTGVGSQIPVTNKEDTQDPQQSQNAKIKRTAGIILISIGLVLAAASFAVSYEIIALPVTAKVVVGLVLGVASVICLIVGTILKNKNTPKVSEEKKDAEKTEESDASAESQSQEEEDIYEDTKSESPRKMEETVTETDESDLDSFDLTKIKNKIITFLQANPKVPLLSKENEDYALWEKHNMIPQDVKQIIEESREQIKDALDTYVEQTRVTDSSPMGSPYAERKENSSETIDHEAAKEAYKALEAQIIVNFQTKLKALLETK